MIEELCVNCGYPESLHKYRTNKCPKNGEAPAGRKQEWLETEYTPKTQTIEHWASQVTTLRQRLAEKEAEIEAMDDLLIKSYRALEADGCNQDLADEILAFKYPPKELS
jgi:hypothetical protein